MTQGRHPDPAAPAAPAVSVVVATRNRAGRLRCLLASLARQTLPEERYEVIVVDDGSTDETPKLLERSAADTTFALRATAGPGRGPAAARNVGWRLARASLVAFTDDDCEAQPGWLAALVETARAAPGAIVQGRTRPIPRERSRLGLLSRTKSIDGPGPWFQTCNVLYARELLEHLGGFDERFGGPFGEDVDLAWRALAAGAEARFEPRALVHHAVERLGPAGFLRSALRDPDEALALKRHPGLRRQIRRLGLFKTDQHALLPLALLGLKLGRRRPPLAALGIPYLLLVTIRCRAAGTPALAAPWLVAYDTIELAQAIRGAVRHRVAIL